MRLAALVLAIAAYAVAAPQAAAQPTPGRAAVPGELLRVRDQARPFVCADAAGNFVVAWLDDYPPAPVATAKTARRDCLPQALRSRRDAGYELIANSYTTGDQLDMSVACAPGGDFLVTWSDRPTATAPHRLRRARIRLRTFPEGQSLLDRRRDNSTAAHQQHRRMPRRSRHVRYRLSQPRPAA
jgi:hypothetical protein